MELKWTFAGEGWNAISAEAKQLITDLLQREPAKRPTAGGLL